MNSKNKKILVTGSSGFLGSHVVDLLTLKGYDVRLFDRTPSPYLRENQEMIVGDILNPDDVKKAVDGVDFIFHFAGISDIEECSQNPLKTVSVNILGTTLLLEEAIKNDIKRFFFASTAYVYSDSGYFYKDSKQACENLIETYSTVHDLKYTILRYGSLYGLRCSENNNIYGLIKQAIETKKITYQGTGEELREFIHVYDAAQITVNCLSKEFENSRLLLTGQEKMKYSELLDMINEMLQNKIEIEFSKTKRTAHYKITPYNFNPKLGRKVTINNSIDLGQGLLELMEDIYKKQKVYHE